MPPRAKQSPKKKKNKAQRAEKRAGLSFPCGRIKTQLHDGKFQLRGNTVALGVTPGAFLETVARVAIDRIQKATSDPSARIRRENVLAAIRKDRVLQFFALGVVDSDPVDVCSTDSYFLAQREERRQKRAANKKAAAAAPASPAAAK